MRNIEPGLSRRQALAGIGLAGVTTAAPVAWKPLATVAFGGIVRVSTFRGADDAERIVNAFNSAPEGATILFDPGAKSKIDRLISIGNGGDVETAKGVRVIANGHRFIYTADGARLEFNGPISPVLDLIDDYIIGSRTLTVAHGDGQLDHFIPGCWIKIVSDAVDGWNRNRGSQQSQYRLGEWAQIRSVTGRRNGIATLTLAEPLKFTRGFLNKGNAREIVEVNSYTAGSNARIFAVLCDSFSWDGGAFFVEDAKSHLGPQGWNTRSLLRIQGFVRPVVQNVSLGPAAGKGLEIQGCVDFTVNSPEVRDLPDFSARSARGSVSAGNLGYGISIGGCWRGVVNNLVARDCRHAITESNSRASANSSVYGILLSIGRTYGTRIINPRVEGRSSAGISTHHGAHAWVIVKPLVRGEQQGFGISLRGPEHTVIAPTIAGQRGIQVFSEFDNDGGADLPGLVGSGNKWMSSAKVVGGLIDCTTEALSATNAFLTLTDGMSIRTRSHYAFSSNGGVLDFASGRFEAEVGGEPPAAEVDGHTTPPPIFYCGDSNPLYGITWAPGVIIRQDAQVNINARLARDTARIDVFGQKGMRAEIVVHGGLQVSLPPGGTGSAFANSIRHQIDRTASVRFSGGSIQTNSRNRN